MESYAFLGRITRPYCDLSGVLLGWAEQCGHLWVYEHEADQTIKRTHCHLFALNSQRDADGLKKLKGWLGLKVDKGNKGSSFKAYNKIHDFDKDLQWKGWYTCLAYFSKGHLKPKLACGENAEEIAELSRQQYAAPEVKQETQTTQVEVKKTSRITQFQIARLAQLEYMNQFQEEFQESRGKFHAKALLNIITRLMRINSMLVHDQVVTRIMQDVQSDMHPEQFANRILSRFKIFGDSIV